MLIRLVFFFLFAKLDFIHCCASTSGSSSGTTTPIAQTCTDLFIQQGTPSILTEQNQPIPTPISTTCTPAGTEYCYPTGNGNDPVSYVTNDGYAISIPQQQCASFCACNAAGTCFVMMGQVDTMRIAPFCNSAGVCCNNIFFQTASDSSGVQSENGAITFTSINQLNGDVFQPFTCNGGNIYPEINRVGCNGCDAIRNQQCT